MADHPVETKSIWLSKTFWMNVIGVVGALIAYFGFDFELDNATQAIIVTSILAVANIVMRFFTKAAIGG